MDDDGLEWQAEMARRDWIEGEERDELRAEVERLRAGILDAVEHMWENRVGVVYVEAGYRHKLLSLLEPSA